MKKKIVFGSLLACFLMLMIPVMPAVQIQSVKYSIKEHFQLLDDLKLKSSKDLQQMMNDEEEFTIRVAGFILLILNVLIRKSLNPFSRIILRIFTIIIFCLFSLIGGLFLTDTALWEIPIRLIFAFLYGLLMPILFKAECINLMLFAREGVGPLGKLFVFLRNYGLYGDKAINKI